MNHPIIIQGGMGAGVSNWVLANAVSRMGQLGVVSGTALDSILARRLQMGDSEGHLQRAMARFPIQEIAQRVYEKYYIPNGKSTETSFKRIPMYSLSPSQELMELTVLANFVEVYLAKEGHNGPVGINYLEKIQMPNLASLYGAMLAGVDYVLMGAGIPREIPGILDKYVNHEEATLRIHVNGTDKDDHYQMRFHPQTIIGKIPKLLKRPNFLAIVSSNTLAISLKRKSTGEINGFVIEGHTAGGHNAPPRGTIQFNSSGEPVYGEKDHVDLEKIKALGLPFWLAGAYGDPLRFQQAFEEGAAGVQIGTPFALCHESGLAEDIKQQVIEKILANEAIVLSDPKASPTDFPFKVFQLENSMSNPHHYEQRTRICDLGYLRTAYKSETGRIHYRCPSEPIETYLRKSGKLEDTENRKCLCNSLLANIGLPQLQRTGYVEKPLVTSGKELQFIPRFFKNGLTTYSAADVIETLCPHLKIAEVPA